MFGMSPVEPVIILVIAIMILGAESLSATGEALTKAFREAMPKRDAFSVLLLIIAAIVAAAYVAAVVLPALR